MQLLTPIAQYYPWGSRTLIPQMRQDQPSTAGNASEPSNGAVAEHLSGEKPIAELWYGAHPGGPSLTPDAPQDTLAALIEADPAQQLGAQVIDTYGERLPFLLKLLAADQPLSLQAHPSLEQAKEGFERDNAAGIPLGAANRNYKDNNHKPELIVALTEFHAMAGFRPLAKTRKLFAALGCTGLDRSLSLLSDDPAAESENLRALFTTWISIPQAARVELITSVVECAQAVLSSAEADTDAAGQQAVEEWMLVTLRNIVELAERYPGDMGVLGALLLNHVVLQPGEATYLDAGNLHAYVRGLGVEIMANSDNVLRGGLTSKHVDVPELVRVLRFESIEDPKIQPHGGVYPIPIKEFALEKRAINGETTVEHNGPTILLVTSGEVEIDGRTLRPTDAAWVAAGEAAVRVQGKGEIFIATVG